MCCGPCRQVPALGFKTLGFAFGFIQILSSSSLLHHMRELGVESSPILRLGLSTVMHGR